MCEACDNKGGAEKCASLQNSKYTMYKIQQINMHVCNYIQNFTPNMAQTR